MPIDIGKAELTGIQVGKSMQTIEKEWGYEHILPSEGYTTKIMEIDPGFRCSLHFHQKKSETFVLVQGHLDVVFYEPDGTKHAQSLTEPLSALVLPACTPHIFRVPKSQTEPTIFIESSTPDDKDDNYRLSKSGKY